MDGQNGFPESYPSSRDVSLALPKSKQNSAVSAQLPRESDVPVPRAARAAGRPDQRSDVPRHAADEARKNQNNNLLVGLAELCHDGVLPRKQLLPVVQDLDLLLVEVT